jgi:hypothetical protein
MIDFSLLMAQAREDEDGFHLNPEQWTLFTMRGNCRERSYRVLTERGMNQGQAYTGKKGSKQVPDPKSNIGQVLRILCTDSISLPVLEAGLTK